MSKCYCGGGYTGEGGLPELAKPLRPGECLTTATHGNAALTVSTLIGLLQAVPQDALIAYESNSDSAFIGRIGVSEDGVVLLHPGENR